MIFIRRLGAHRKHLFICKVTKCGFNFAVQKWQGYRVWAGIFWVIGFFLCPAPEKRLWLGRLDSNNNEFYHQQSFPIFFFYKKTAESDYLSVRSDKHIQERVTQSSHFKGNCRNRQEVAEELFICTDMIIHVHLKKALQKSSSRTLQHNLLCHWHQLLFIHSFFKIEMKGLLFQHPSFDD